MMRGHKNGRPSRRGKLKRKRNKSKPRFGSPSDVHPDGNGRDHYVPIQSQPKSARNRSRSRKGRSKGPHSGRPDAYDASAPTPYRPRQKLRKKWRQQHAHGSMSWQQHASYYPYYVDQNHPNHHPHPPYPHHNVNRNINDLNRHPPPHWDYWYPTHLPPRRHGPYPLGEERPPRLRGKGRNSKAKRQRQQLQSQHPHHPESNGRNGPRRDRSKQDDRKQSGSSSTNQSSSSSHDQSTNNTNDGMTESNPNPNAHSLSEAQSPPQRNHLPSYSYYTGTRSPSSERRKNRSSGRRAVQQPVKELCAHFGSAAGCKWGSRCFKSHSNPNSVKFCELFRVSGGCPWGNRCYDRHHDFFFVKHDRSRSNATTSHSNQNHSSRSNQESQSQPVPPSQVHVNIQHINTSINTTINNTSVVLPPSSSSPSRDRGGNGNKNKKGKRRRAKTPRSKQPKEKQSKQMKQSKSEKSLINGREQPLQAKRAKKKKSRRSDRSKGGRGPPVQSRGDHNDSVSDLDHEDTNDDQNNTIESASSRRLRTSSLGAADQAPVADVPPPSGLSKRARIRQKKRERRKARREKVREEKRRSKSTPNPKRREMEIEGTKTGRRGKALLSKLDDEVLQFERSISDNTERGTSPTPPGPLDVDRGHERGVANRSKSKPKKEKAVKLKPKEKAKSKEKSRERNRERGRGRAKVQAERVRDDERDDLNGNGADRDAKVRAKGKRKGRGRGNRDRRVDGDKTTAESGNRGNRGNRNGTDSDADVLEEEEKVSSPARTPRPRAGRRSKSESRSNPKAAKPGKVKNGIILNTNGVKLKLKKGRKLKSRKQQIENGKTEETVNSESESKGKRKNKKIQRVPTSIYKRIDDGLAAYYANCGRHDYYTAQRVGKFMEFVTLNAIDEDTVRLELDDTADPNNCVFLDLDQRFPLKQRKWKRKSRRNAAIFDVMQQIYKFGRFKEEQTQNGKRNKSKGKKASNNDSNPSSSSKAPKAPRTENGKLSPKSSKSSKAKISKIDWSTIYSEDGDHCMLVANGCSYLSRMIDAVIKYSRLNLKKQNDRKRFVGVMAKYDSFHRDFMHIMECHNKKDIDYIQIYKQRDYAKIKECNNTNCLLLALHDHGDSKKQLFAEHNGNVSNGKGQSKDVMFYRDLMDAMHCYLVHGYDIGLRIKTMEKKVKNGKKRNGLKNGHHRLQKVEDVEAKMKEMEAPIKSDDGGGGGGDTFEFVTRMKCPDRTVFLFSSPQCKTRKH